MWPVKAVNNDDINLLVTPAFIIINFTFSREVSFKIEYLVATREVVDNLGYSGQGFPFWATLAFPSTGIRDGRRVGLE